MARLIRMIVSKTTKDPRLPKRANQTQSGMALRKQGLQEGDGRDAQK